MHNNPVFTILTRVETWLKKIHKKIQEITNQHQDELQ